MFGSKEGVSCVGDKVRHPRKSCIAFLYTKVLGAFPRPGASDAPETKIHISDHSVRQQGSSRTPRITGSNIFTCAQFSEFKNYISLLIIYLRILRCQH